MTPVDYTGKILEGPSPCACPFCGKHDGNLIVTRNHLSWKYTAHCSLCGFGTCGGYEPLSVMGIFKTLADQQAAAHLMKGALEDIVPMLERILAEKPFHDHSGEYTEGAKKALDAAREAGIE